ncbi:MAG: hypothetical protein II453_16425 [Alphaproteobacteria bacterium]|nr:hypothetical protein [Alphaproteobacteria bacterium]MBQ3945374.1 hypothetical protein [Alphaproteobacteria bacterium]
MDTSIKTQLKQWAEMSNNHPCDDERLYEIAISTYANKIEQDVFQDITGEVLFEKYYTIYEQLINFVKYLKAKDILKC